MRLLIGGSPCTHWSVARTKGREVEPKGIGWELFDNYLIAKKKFQPDYFLYENNKSMAPPIREQITRELGVEPILINSALLTAQNRLRLYWTNIPGITQPEDRGIILRDILEDVMPKCKGSCPLQTPGNSPVPAMIPVNITANGKAQCLRATYYKDGVRNMVGNTIDRKTCVAIPLHVGDQDVSCEDCVTPTSIDNYQFIQGETTGRNSYQFLGGLEKEEGKRWLVDGKSYSRNFNQGRRMFGVEGKSVTVTAQSFGLAGHAGLYVIHAEAGAGCPGELRMTPDGLVFDVAGKSFRAYEVRDGQIYIKRIPYPIKLEDGCYIIRKLTVRECMRLQTIPECYIFPVSATQAYKMIGNGWSVDVISHILAFCPGITSEPLKVLSMYDGMSCGQLALNKLGAHIDSYYATEIDKYAIKATQYNFPDTIQLGDAFQVREDGWKLPEKGAKV